MLEMLGAILAAALEWAIRSLAGSTWSSVMKQDPLACSEQGLGSKAIGRTYMGVWPLLVVTRELNLRLARLLMDKGSLERGPALLGRGH